VKPPTTKPLRVGTSISDEEINGVINVAEHTFKLTWG
jgi:hypothetical protein